MRLVTLLALTIVLVEDSADAQVAAMDTESLLDSLEKMPPKKLKKFVRSNGMDCEGCKKKQWMARAREVVKLESDGKAAWGGGEYATAPDGSMQMSREEFKQQLHASVQGAEGIPSMDDDHIEDMWIDFSRRIRAGEVAGNGGQGWLGGLFGRRSSESWLHLFMLAGMCLTLHFRRKQRNERKAALKKEQEMQAENERSKQKAAIPSSAVQQSTIGSTGKLHRHDRQDAVNRNAEHEENMVADVDELSLSSTEESSDARGMISAHQLHEAAIAMSKAVKEGKSTAETLESLAESQRQAATASVQPRTAIRERRAAKNSRRADR